MCVVEATTLHAYHEQDIAGSALGEAKGKPTVSTAGVVWHLSLCPSCSYERVAQMLFSLLQTDHDHPSRPFSRNTPMGSKWYDASEMVNSGNKYISRIKSIWPRPVRRRENG